MENYFNYFTEIEQCFQRQRGAPALLSTLDWALIESWKDAGIPLEAVCSGIERTFEKHLRRPRRMTKINGLAYCSQAVMAAAEAASVAAAERGPRERSAAEAPFAPERVVSFIAHYAAALGKSAESARAAGSAVLASDLDQHAEALSGLAAQGGEALTRDLEGLERVLTAVEDRISASLARATPLDLTLKLREEVDRSLASCRRSMTASQLESVERQFLKRRLFEHYELPRLSLFYI